jgi:hypothetical protein
MNVRRGFACLVLLALPACLDSIVGTECATGYSPCQGACVVAGTCAAPDAASEPVDAATLETSEEAGTVLDAEANDSEGTDAQALDEGSGQDDAPALDDTGPAPALAIDAEVSLDGPPCADCLDAETFAGGGTDVDDTMVGGTSVDDASVDPSPADAANTAAIDSALLCADPQVICNEQCVDTSLDPENCGDCNSICASGVCNIGECLICAAEESVCGRQCANLATDPDNCGACGSPCMSGLCSNGQCEAAGTGRAIVIGHDYLKNRPAMNRILGNAVFLWPVNPVRLLVYEGDANAAAIAGADAAIAQVASATGRRSVRTAAGATDVPGLLASTDVFLIYGQELANDATLDQLGLDWSATLLAFMNAGGTVVLLDASYAGNSGTCQILAYPGLFLVARAASASGDVCTVVAHGDALTTGLPKTYLCEKNSTSFTVNDLSTAVTRVVEDSGLAVVVHKIF